MLVTPQALGNLQGNRAGWASAALPWPSVHECLHSNVTQSRLTAVLDRQQQHHRLYFAQLRLLCSSRRINLITSRRHEYDLLKHTSKEITQAGYHEIIALSLPAPSCLARDSLADLGKARAIHHGLLLYNHTTPKCTFSQDLPPSPASCTALGARPADQSASKDTLAFIIEFPQARPGLTYRAECSRSLEAPAVCALLVISTCIPGMSRCAVAVGMQQAGLDCLPFCTRSLDHSNRGTVPGKSPV